MFNISTYTLVEYKEENENNRERESRETDCRQKAYMMWFGSIVSVSVFVHVEFTCLLYFFVLFVICLCKQKMLAIYQ